MDKRRGGFTIIELVVTLVVLGILAAVVLPQFAGDLSFKTRGYYDQVFGAVEFARQQAVSHRRVVCVRALAAPTRVVVVYSPSSPTALSTCSTALTDPKTNAAFNLPAPTGVTISPLPGFISFDWYGRPSAAATWTISGDGSYTLTVEAETGHVH